MKNIINEGIINKQRFVVRPEVTKEYCEKEIQYILKKIDENLEMFTYKFPSANSENNVYPPIENTCWTGSFWTGMLWLAYEVTGDEKYRKVAEIQVDSFKKRAEERIMIETHDLGFLYTLSCVAAYKLTGNEVAKKTALTAADLLMERYFEKAGIIQAWGDLNDPANRGRIIIDCMLNIPLLYWASEVTGDMKYFQAASNHKNQTANNIIREDSSCYHTFFMDVETGEPRFGKTAQGYSDNSAWARGQAWGIYGFALNYSYTQDESIIETNKKITNYFLNRLPEDFINYWDLIFTEGDEPRDSSAAAIAACGLMELSKNLPLTDENKLLYENAALYIVKSLAENYTTINLPEANGILQHGVYYRFEEEGTDECLIWGDYYYFEALVRLTKDWKPYW